MAKLCLNVCALIEKGALPVHVHAVDIPVVVVVEKPGRETHAFRLGDTSLGCHVFEGTVALW